MQLAQIEELNQEEVESEEMLPIVEEPSDEKGELEAVDDHIVGKCKILCF